MDITAYNSNLFRIEIIWISKFILEAFHRASVDNYDIVAYYNLTQKKFGRIFQAIKSTIVYDLVIGIIITSLTALNSKTIL